MKRLFSFFFSKLFLWQLVIAVSVTFVLVNAVGWGLARFTQHNKTVSVPDLKGMTLIDAAQSLEALSLRYEVYDTLAFSPDFDPYAVREQQPAPAERVKSNRKIYVAINRGGFQPIALPDVIQLTERSARNRLESSGLKVNDSAIYIDAIGRNMVYELRLGEDRVQPGTLIDQSDLLTLVLGNGKDSIQ